MPMPTRTPHARAALILLAPACLAALALAQPGETNPTPAAVPDRPAENTLPAAESHDVAPFLGRWSGTLNAYNPGRGPAQFPMALEIERTEDPTTHVWRIIYGVNERQDVRDYRLVTRDADAGEYAIDERNSIVIPAFYAGGAFHSNFRLDTTVINLSYTLVDDSTIRFDLTSWTTTDPEVTGGEGPVPEVTTVRMTASQTAVLTRESPEDQQPPDTNPEPQPQPDTTPDTEPESQ